jgi:predicted N-acyltransferase
MAIQKDHELTALMTVFIQSSKGWKRFFTRRGIVFGGPIFSDVKSGRELMQAVWNELKSELIYIESRNLFDFSDLEMEKSVSQWKFLPWKNYWVPLQQGESPMKIMSESRRRQIKKALKIGVTWREAQTQREVSDLYDILENLYKNKVKKPLLSLEFFNKMFHISFS